MLATVIPDHTGHCGQFQFYHKTKRYGPSSLPLRQFASISPSSESYHHHYTLLIHRNFTLLLCLESSYTSFILHIALHFSIHVLMFGSATFLTPQYWVSQPNKHTQEPHHQRKFWDLFVTSSLPSTSTSVSATTLLPLLHLHTSFCSKHSRPLHGTSKKNRRGNKVPKCRSCTNVGCKLCW